MGLFFKFFSEKKNTMTATATGKARNYALASGVYRFGKGKMYHKKALYKKIKRQVPKKVAKSAPAFIEKPIGGDKDGGKRMVRVKKLPAYYAPELKGKKSTSKNFFSKQKRSLRPSLTPGTVCIVLAGVHKGKKTIFLKQLSSGLCLITGPHFINGCPMRRINQNFLIATATKLDISAVKVPEKINDAYFRRIKTKRPKKEEGDIFEKKTEEYIPSEQRKADQAKVDEQIIAAIKAREDKKTMFGYLGTMFGLRNGQYP